MCFGFESTHSSISQFVTWTRLYGTNNAALCVTNIPQSISKSLGGGNVAWTTTQGFAVIWSNVVVSLQKTKDIFSCISCNCNTGPLVSIKSAIMLITQSILGKNVHWTPVLLITDSYLGLSTSREGNFGVNLSKFEEIGEGEKEIFNYISRMIEGLLK